MEREPLPSRDIPAHEPLGPEPRYLQGVTSSSPRSSDERPVRDSAVAVSDDSIALFADEEAGGFRTRWDSVQTLFVDSPREAVEQANALVGEVMIRLSDGFNDQRKRLEAQWDRDSSVSTEDLRLALKRYRSFFERLLSL
jgi:hypothetical protein